MRSPGCDARSLRRRSSDSRSSSESRLYTKSGEKLFSFCSTLGWLHAGYVLALVLSLEGVRDDTVRLDFAASGTGLVGIQVDVTFCLVTVRMTGML